MAKAKKETLSADDKLKQALVPESEQPYEVPENWCWVKLQYICEYLKAGGDKPKSFSLIKDEYFKTPVVANGIDNDGIIGYTDIESVDNSYTITISGRGTIGFSVYRNYIYMPIVRLIVVKPYKKINCLYLKYSFNHFEEKGTGSSIPQLTVPMIKDKHIPLPPLAEQQRIVDRIESLFAKLDEAKEKLQDFLDSYETRKASILHKAFTGELTEKWRKENGVSLESWEDKQLKDVCKINPSKINTKDLPDELEVSFFPMPALSEIYGAITQPQTRILKDVRSGFTNFIKDDVVFAKITPCMENGKSAIIGELVNNIGYGTTEFHVMRCGEKLHNRYFYHIVRDITFRDKAKAVMTGAVGQQRVPKSFLEEYPLSLPTIIEQTEIVQILDSLLEKEQKAKETAETVLENINLIKKSILARAFRGELGTNVPEEESAVELLKRMME